MMTRQDLLSDEYIEEFCELFEQMESICGKVKKTVCSDSSMKSEKKWYQVVADTIIFIVNRFSDVAIALITRVVDLLKCVGNSSGLFNKIGLAG